MNQAYQTQPPSKGQAITPIDQIKACFAGIDSCEKELNLLEEQLSFVLSKDTEPVPCIENNICVSENDSHLLNELKVLNQRLSSLYRIITDIRSRIHL